MHIEYTSIRHKTLFFKLHSGLAGTQTRCQDCATMDFFYWAFSNTIWNKSSTEQGNIRPWEFHTTLFKLSQLLKSPSYTLTDYQKWIFDTKGQHSVETEGRVMVLFLWPFIWWCCVFVQNFMKKSLTIFKTWSRHKMLFFELQPLSVTLTYVRHFYFCTWKCCYIVELCFLFYAHRLMMLYICTKFNEWIFNHFRDVEKTGNIIFWTSTS